MKLAGPQPSIRFIVVTPRRVDYVVSGVFPPEDAPSFRLLAAEHAKRIAPVILKKWEADMREWEQELLYGRPGAPEPRGLLFATNVKRSTP